MDECVIGGQAGESGFDELATAMKDDLYWVRFFARPCCPAPDLEGATDMLDRLIGEVEARQDFTREQKDALADTIESRKRWYATSGLCRGSRA
ncbi:MAG: hypothetical protein IJ087_12650 [Eggerthellaceae bacterium]|nr:hypothetical protein [Eggerthellaceae bacterium]